MKMVALIPIKFRVEGLGKEEYRVFHWHLGRQNIYVDDKKSVF